jgi:lipopolysaccharide/colanic/teichoic acid biosynthesis glycosyltransferase
MRLTKRIFDLILALFGLAITWPILLAIAVAIWLEDRGPVFFKQERVGYQGKHFRIWKFRSMVVNAEKLGKQITVGRDPRITRVGAFVRKTKLDELPQLINVLLGEMSFVGPRPEVPKYVAMYTEQQRKVLDLMPGITDNASILYRSESEVLAQSADPERTYIEEVMPEKIRINLQYSDKRGLQNDLAVIVRTLLALLKR